MEKELTEALKEHREAIEKKTAELVAASDAKAEALKKELAEMQATAKSMQEQIDAQNVEMKKAAIANAESVKTFAQSLKESFTKESVAISGMSKKYVQALQMEVKSFLETADASITTGSLLPNPQIEVGVSKAPDRMPFLLDIVNKGVANSQTIYWTQRKTRTDNSGVVSEGAVTKLSGGNVAQSVLGYETKSASMANLLAFIKVSNNSLEDIDWLMSEVQTELVTMMLLNLDGYILNGTIAVNGFDGILQKATAFDAGTETLQEGAKANNFDALVFAINQVQVANFKPNYVVLHPSDVRDMKLTRDDNGNYMLPPTMSAGNISVDGIPVIANTGMTKGSYLVGDFNKAKFWTRKGLELKVWEQNEDDAINQLKTITLYMRGTMVIKDADALAFVTDTFANTKADIQPVNAG